MSQVGCVVTHWIVGNEKDKGIPNAQSKNRIRNHMRRYSAFAIVREGARSVSYTHLTLPTILRV